MTSKHLKTSLLFIVAIILTLGLSISFQSLLAAWIAPLVNPSGCTFGNPGCDAPINVGPTSQSKTGNLGVVGTFGVGDNSYFVGKVGIGTAPSSYKLDVQGGQINSSGGYCMAGDCKTAWSQVGLQTETDPLVYAWAKASSKPAYSFGEISGAVTDAQVPDNITVTYAATAGNADTVDGYHVSVAGNANTLPTRDGSGYLIPENWTQLNGYYGLYSPNNGAHFYPNNGSYGSWRVAGSRNSWYGLEFDTAAGQTSFMVGTTGQGWGSQMTGFHNNSYGWLWRFDHSTLAVGNVPIARIPDIGSASVNYAASAGSAGSVAWGNITSIPAGFADGVDNKGLEEFALPPNTTCSYNNYCGNIFNASVTLNYYNSFTTTGFTSVGLIGVKQTNGNFKQAVNYTGSVYGILSDDVVSCNKMYYVEDATWSNCNCWCWSNR